MIEVTLNQPEFEYDIHSLIKAFYPSEYVGVSAEKKEYDEPVTSRMHVEYTDAAITLRWQQGETMPAAERTLSLIHILCEAGVRLCTIAEDRGNRLGGYESYIAKKRF